MPALTFPRTLTALLSALALVMMLWALDGHAASAGKVVASSAPATIVATTGKSRNALPGTPIESGERLLTGDKGRLSVKFSDDSLVQINAQSEFRIDQYAFNGGSNESDKGLFSLVKGGFRTVTGALGKSGRGTYRVTTPAATIGIRGTEYSARLDNGLHVQVDHGEISLTNRAGAFSVSEGQRAYVANRSSAPKYLQLGGAANQAGTAGGRGGTNIQGNTSINAAGKDLSATAVGNDNDASNAIGTIRSK